MKFIKKFSFSRLLFNFQKLFIRIRPIEDKAIAHLLNEKIKKFGVNPSKIGILNYKIEVLNQIWITGNVRNGNEFIIGIAEDLFPEVSDSELDAHFALAIADSLYSYQARYLLIAIVPIFLLLLNLNLPLFAYAYIPTTHDPFKEIHFVCTILSYVVSLYIVERLRLIGVYVKALQQYNIKIETILLLNNNFLKKYVKFRFLVPIESWIKFMTPRQIQKLQKLVEEKTEVDFLYMIKTYFKNPIILANLIAILAILVFIILQNIQK